MNSKFQALRDGDGKPLALTLAEGWPGDHKGAAMLLDSFCGFDHGGAPRE
ncbi:hypothetical protein [uncultured Desulfovibrio sp.]|nr:hypothetical protein [uncultured Desulfovibrio sp.]